MQIYRLKPEFSGSTILHRGQRLYTDVDYVGAEFDPLFASGMLFVFDENAPPPPPKVKDQLITLIDETIVPARQVEATVLNPVSIPPNAPLISFQDEEPIGTLVSSLPSEPVHTSSPADIAGLINENVDDATPEHSIDGLEAGSDVQEHTPDVSSLIDDSTAHDGPQPEGELPVSTQGEVRSHHKGGDKHEKKVKIRR